MNLSLKNKYLINIKLNNDEERIDLTSIPANTFFQSCFQLFATFCCRIVFG